MERRSFIQAAGLSLFIPAVAGFARAGGWTDEAALADCFFFDDRFLTARALAAGWSGPAAPTAIQGDVTRIWRTRLAHEYLLAPLTLSGVTTESFHFCLSVLLAEQAQIDTRITRIDRDLHLWAIRSEPHRHAIPGGPVS